MTHVSFLDDIRVAWLAWGAFAVCVIASFWPKRRA